MSFSLHQEGLSRPHLYTLQEEEEHPRHPFAELTSTSARAADTVVSPPGTRAYTGLGPNLPQNATPTSNKPPYPQASTHQAQGRAGSQSSGAFLVRNLDENPHGLESLPSASSRTASHANLPTDSDHPAPPATSPAVHARNASDPISPPAARRSPLSKMTTVTQLQRSNSARPRPDQSSALNVQTDKQQASSKISAFFGWKGNNSVTVPTTPIAESSPTTISSDRSTPDQSPYPRSPTTFTSSVKSVPPQIDITKANNNNAGSYIPDAHLMPPPTPGMSIQLEEMEEELRDLSTELASSIRREMELEDEIEQFQLGGERGRRTSDYFSDSAASSVKDGGTNDRSVEDILQKQVRKLEQERAQLKIDLAEKLEQERSKKKVVEGHVETLQSHISELERSGPSQGNDRLQELERRIIEEREMKQNYEDLLHALKGDLSRHQNERDNLRDEVVPSLRARVDGLEAEASQYQTLQYEHAKMQQELQALKGEDGSKGGIARSASTMRRNGALSRSNSIAKGNSQPLESREQLSEKVKEIEAQRDALHKALKNVLTRQDLQKREFNKRLRLVEAQRDAAVSASTPRPKAFAAEVKELRSEVNLLRNRAEDALESKWQCEKNLAGLKMNLDRAEQETTSLRALLKQNDILIPDTLSGQPTMDSATSESLEQAYEEFKNSLKSISELRDGAGLDGETDAALSALLTSLDDTKAQRDFALSQAQHYQAQADNLRDVRSFHETENASLATRIGASTARIQHLNEQVQRQLYNNQGLREKLDKAVARGEQEQRDNASRITTLQGRLRQLEDRLVAAQAHSEEKVSENEDVVRSMTKSDHPSLNRLVKRTSRTGPRSPLMPSTPGLRNPLSPRLKQGESLPSALKTEFLEQRVKELEKALAETDKEMQEVVQRMNQAQIEVLELQGQRDEAIKQTRSLQDKVVQEGKNMGGLMAMMRGK